MDGLLILAGAIGIGWLLIQLGGHWYASRRRTLESMRLDQKIGGLLLFGKPGAYLMLEDVIGGDRILLKKVLEQGAETLHFEVSGPNATESIADQIVSRFSAVGDGLHWSRSWDTQRGVHRGPLAGREASDEVILERLIRVAARELGHQANSRYKIEFEGPADYNEVSKYYGWRPRRRGGAQKE